MSSENVQLDKVGIIVQARMGSTRLPAKTIKEIAGQPMLWHIIERLKKVKQAKELIVATSVNPGDKDVVKLAESCGVRYFVGAEEDVLDRLYQAAKKFQLRHIVRATADNPLVDPEEANRLISFHVKSAADYSSNRTEENSGLPVGVGVETLSFTALERSWIEAKNQKYREHIDDYILQNRERFNVQVLQAPEDKRAPHLRLTVDTQADLDFMRDIYRRFYVPGRIVLVEQVVKYLVAGKSDRNNR